MNDVPLSEDTRRWRHSLRNELNIITMATATAASLIEHGERDGHGGHDEGLDRVRQHLARAEAACRRCAELVRDWPDGG